MTKNPIKSFMLLVVAIAFTAMMLATLWFLFCAEWQRATGCFVGMLMASWIIGVFSKEDSK